MYLYPVLFSIFLSAPAQIRYSTLIDGAGTDTGNLVTTDASRNTIVAGFTSSNQIAAFGESEPTREPTGSFVLKLDEQGKRLWIRRLGVSAIRGLQLDGQGNIYLAGSGATPTTFAATPGAYRTSGFGAFLMRIDSGGEIGFATFFDSLGGVSITSLALENSGNLVFCGQTTATDDFPSTGDAWQNPQAGVRSSSGFCSILSGDGTRLIFSSLFGDQGTFPKAAVVTGENRLIVAGNASGQGLPMINPWQAADRRKTAYQGTPDGSAWHSSGGPELGALYSFAQAGGKITAATSNGIWSRDEASGNWSQNSKRSFSNTILHPHNPKYACAFLSIQVHCSADGGSSWEWKFSLDRASRILPDPDREGLFYAFIESRGIVSIPLAGGEAPFSVPIPAGIDFAVNRTPDAFQIWITNGTGISRSVDGGSTFTPLAEIGRHSKLYFAGGQTLYAADNFGRNYSTRLQRSDDEGRTWTVVDLPFSGPLTVFTASPGSPHTVWAAGDGGTFYRTEDGGATWTSAATGLAGSTVTAVFVSPDGLVWAGCQEVLNGFVAGIDLNAHPPRIEYSTLVGGEGGGALQALALDPDTRLPVAAGFVGHSPGPDDPFATADNTAAGFLLRMGADGQPDSMKGLPVAPNAIAFDSIGTLHLTASLAPDSAVYDLVSTGAAQDRASNHGAWLQIGKQGEILDWLVLNSPREDSIRASSVGSDGAIRLTGNTTSRDFATTGDALQRSWANPRGFDFGAFLIVTKPN